MAARRRYKKFFIAQRAPEVSRRNNVTAFEISFIMADSDPSRSTPCNEASEAAEIISPRQTSVEAFPSTLLLAGENFRASSLLICNSGLSFCVALASDRTELLSGAFCNFEKSAAVGAAERSECRKTFGSRCFVGFHFRSASICRGGDPVATKQLCVERNRGFPIGGPWAVFTSLLRAARDQPYRR